MDRTPEQMMAWQDTYTSKDHPPTEWLAEVVTIDVDQGIYSMPSPDEATDHPTIWHWCTKLGHWAASGTRKHDLIATDPLHLEPSLLFYCCSLHGWIRDGRWESA